MNEQVVNLAVDAKTLDACLKKISNIGSTVYRNSCTGQDVVIPWGSVDWLGAVLISGLTLTVIVAAVVLTRD